ncbi:MAG: Mur ligase family protein [Patescibacteria group bacterium]|nr:Mur ligase family protein [Patescibacteria group bacterium]
MINALLILLGKSLIKFGNTLNIGSGSTWPGHIALKLNKNFIKQISSKNKNLKIVLIAGTNGKTTTSKLIKHILEKNSLKVFHNEAGANLLNGIASSFIKNSNLSGKLPYDVAIFEIDENTLPLILREINHYSILLLNLFRDQLDRYGEVNTIAKNWQQALKKVDKNTFLFLNGDDPQIYSLGQENDLKTYYFGISDKYMDQKEIPHDVDSVYCPNCSHKLNYSKMSYSHLGKFKCYNCGFKQEKVETFADQKINYPLFGKYNIYNTNAAILLTSKAFNIPTEKVIEFTEEFKPAFGRQEIVKYKGKNIIVLLSKNPTGFNQSIEATINYSKDEKPNALVVLNDRIPDGRDVSWIWDVDFNDLSLAKKIIISGDRTFDLAIRFKYALNDSFEQKTIIEEDLEKAINTAVSQTEENKTLFILPTYSAMLETRKILGGKKIL